MLRYSLDYPHAAKQDLADTPPMHEGYGLFIEERRYYTRCIGISIFFILTVVGVVYHQTFKLWVIDALL